MSCRWFLAFLTLVIGCSHAVADSFVVTVKVVDAKKKPVARADVALFWQVKERAMTPQAERSAVTDAAGKALLRVDDWNEKRPVLVLSADRKLGGIIGVSRADDGKEVTITLGPTVRVKGKLECKELNRKPPWTNTTITTEGLRAYFTQDLSNPATFEFVLPVGKYRFGSYGTDVIQVSQTVNLSADRPEHDLGTIDMKASPIARLRGKPMPEWVIDDARGAKPTVKLADYRGKWVLIEFWGFWCGPCVAGALPELIGLYEDHDRHRDKFEVIAIHVHHAKTFAEVDAKLPNIKERFWRGKDLPFPVLLDATGKTADLYGISGYPTGVLVDPDGKLVGDATAAELEEKLPPLSIAKRWARHRDIYKNVVWGFEPGRNTVKEFADILKRSCRCPVDVDFSALEACGLKPYSPLPGVLVGMPVTLRSVEELLLAPHGLGIAPSADGKKLLVTRSEPAKKDPSYLQMRHAAGLRRQLESEATDEERNTKKPLVIKDQSLIDAVKQMSREFNYLPIALDARAMRAGKIDPSARVSGRIGLGGLGKALARMVDTLGLTVEVRHEVVLLTPKK
jgi:thiol-disulfide isomerase/thioredoxin